MTAKPNSHDRTEALLVSLPSQQGRGSKGSATVDEGTGDRPRWSLWGGREAAKAKAAALQRLSSYENRRQDRQLDDPRGAQRFRR